MTELTLSTLLLWIAQMALLPFQVIHFFTRVKDNTRLRFFIFSVSYALLNTFSIWFEINDYLDTSVEHSVLVLSGIPILSYYFYYLIKELGLKTNRYFNHKLLFLCLSANYVATAAVSIWMNTEVLFVSLTEIIVFYFSIQVVLKIWMKTESKSPIIYASYLGIVVVSVLPMLLFLIQQNYLRSIFINIPYYIVLLAYFIHYFNETKMENQLLKLLGFKLNSNLEQRFMNVPDSLLTINLTPRELEIVGLMRRNYNYQEIAKNLYISDSTVSKHASNIFKKTNTTNRAEFLKKYGER